MHPYNERKECMYLDRRSFVFTRNDHTSTEAQQKWCTNWQLEKSSCCYRVKFKKSTGGIHSHTWDFIAVYRKSFPSIADKEIATRPHGDPRSTYVVSPAGTILFGIQHLAPRWSWAINCLADVAQFSSGFLCSGRRQQHPTAVQDSVSFGIKKPHR